MMFASFKRLQQNCKISHSTTSLLTLVITFDDFKKPACLFNYYTYKKQNQTTFDELKFNPTITITAYKSRKIQL